MVDEIPIKTVAKEFKVSLSYVYKNLKDYRDQKDSHSSLIKKIDVEKEKTKTVKQVVGILLGNKTPICKFSSIHDKVSLLSTYPIK
jgi:hypothetical protein